MTDIKNQVFRDETKTFHCNVVDCEFYNCRITISAPYFAKTCKIIHPKQLSATVIDCFLDMEGWKEPLEHHTSNMTYASGPGEVVCNNSSGVNIINRVIPRSSSPPKTYRTYNKDKTSPKAIKKLVKSIVREATTSSHTSNMKRFVTPDGSVMYCADNATCVSGDYMISNGELRRL